MSAADPNVRELSAQDRQKLDERLGDFHRTWEPGQLDRTLADLPVDLPYRLAAVTGLVAVDLEMQWQNGQHIRVEEYLEKYPELGTAENVSIELLLAEFLAQERYHSAPDLNGFLARFPQQADELRRLIALARSPRMTGRVKPSGNTSIHSQPVEDGPALPEQFDRYRIQKKLGQGGMGTVYLAYDTRLDRKVALKVPRFAPGSNHENLERFYREAKATATITHPNLCPLYDVGEVEGTPFLTMAYIEGWPLSKFIRPDKLLPQFGVATVVRIVAHAIEEAHKRGVIHRDLKPGNIMINKRGEPIVMDFGLARWVNADKEDIRLTRSGAILGAPVYMSPEQVYGDVDAMGPGCDVYSLGVILYELLTGRLPFEGPTTAVLAKTLIQPPKPPSAYRPDVDPRLEAICLKAMAKKISERYATMDEFAAALTEYIRAERQAQTLTSLSMTKMPGNGAQASASDIGAAPSSGPLAGGKSGSGKGRSQATTTTVTVPSGMTKTDMLGEAAEALDVADVLDARPSIQLEKPRGNRMVLWAALAGAGLLAALVLLVPLAWLLWPPSAPRTQVPAPALNEGSIRIALSDMPDDLEVRLNGDAIDRARLASPLTLKSGEYRLEVNASKFEPWTQAILVKDGVNQAVDVTLRPKAPAVVDVKPPPAVDVKPPPAVDVKPPPPVVVRTLELMRFGAPKHDVERVAVSHDGRFALSAGKDGTVRWWDLVQGRELRKIAAHKERVHFVAFSPDDRLALSCGKDMFACLWDLQTGDLVKKFVGHTDEVWGAIFSPDGKQVVTCAGDKDKTARLWDAATGDVLKTFKGHENGINAIALSPDGKRLLTAGWDSTLRVWDMEDAKELHSFKPLSGTGRFASVAFFGDGRRAVAAVGAKVKLYDTIDFKELRSMDDGHKDGSVWIVAASPGGHLLLSAGSDKTICLWEAGSGKLLHRYTGHTGSVPGAVFTPDGTHILSGSADFTLRLWDLPRRDLYDPPLLPVSQEIKKETLLLQAPSSMTPPKFVEQVSFTADGKRAVWSGDDKMVHVWDLAENKEVTTFKDHKAGVRSFALLPDGKRVLSASYDGTLNLWDIDSGKSIRSFKGHDKQVKSVAVTSDGKRAVSVGDDRFLHVWNVDDGKEILKLQAHGGTSSIFAVAITPDNQEAITAGMGADKTIRRWNLETGAEIAKWTVSDDIHTLAVSPDGRRVLSGGKVTSGGKENAMQLWDRETGERLARFIGHTGNVTCVRFSPDGRWILSSCSEDGTIRLWNSETSQEMARYVPQPQKGTKGVAFSPDARTALSCSADSSVRLWTLPDYTAQVPIGELKTNSSSK
jgi:WD40 repeat protein/serine/threonine protein kinase